MAIPLPTELGNNSVVIGIDKDKSSQWAVKWAVEHFLKGKDRGLVLVHVRTPTTHCQAESVPIHERAPNASELQQLFLPFRGFCARKGFDVHEVVLQDIDISSALISYVVSNSIGTIVVGGSNRNALTRRFKQADVPTAVTKTAPEFCTVYVIHKERVQSMRASNPNSVHKESVSSKSNVSSSSISPYFTNNSSSANESLTYNTSTSSGSVNPNSLVPESPTSRDSTSKISDNLSDNTSSFNYYNARLKNLLERPPAPPRRSGNFDEHPRLSSELESRKGDEIDHFTWNNEGAITPSRNMQSTGTLSRFNQIPTPSPTRFTQSSDDYAEHGHNLPYMRSLLSDGSSYNSSSDNGRFESSEYSHDQSSYASSSHSSYSQSNAMEKELDREIGRLKHDTHKAMHLYQTISDQTAIAKQQANDMLNQDGAHSIEDMKVAKQATLLVAELERLRNKAEMDAANLAKRLNELEAEKRQIVEQRETRNDNKKRAASGSGMSHQIYTLEEIEVATDYFSSSQQIGEGGYGPVYRAMLQQTPVAIKVLRPDVSKGLQQFQQEIEVLGRIRHPNMVLLLGTCPQYGCLVYEYMDNGSLEDRLFCKNNTPPIPWRARFKIAAEITTALLFLHQTKPKPMVHRDLKPANILLDANYRSKISDVGLARLVPPSVANEMTQYHMTSAAGTFCYIDPEYQQTGLLGTKSDVYSLGVVLLQLITAKPPMALAYNVEESIEAGEFACMLDQSVTDWPVEYALSLAQLALKCCELRKKDRPDLGSVVLPELNRLRNFALCS